MKSRPRNDERKHPDILLFERLTRAVADSSTLIRMERAGFLALTAAAVRLFTVPEVLAETGKPGFEEHVTLTEIPPAETPEKRRTDRLVVRAALAHGVSVFSEDRKILLEADREGIPYLNALMVLNFLLWKRAVTPEEYGTFQTRLLREALYGKPILRYAEELHMEILKEL